MSSIFGNNGLGGISGNGVEIPNEISNVPGMASGRSNGGLAQGQFEMALSENNYLPGGSRLDVRGNDNSSSTSSMGQAVGRNIGVNKKELSGVVGGRGDGWGSNGRDGCQLPYNLEGDEDRLLFNFRGFIDAQNEEIGSLLKMFGDYKILMQAVFSVMSKEQIRELKSLYQNKSNEMLKEMIDFSDSVRTAKAMLTQDKGNNGNFILNNNTPSYANKTKSNSLSNRISARGTPSTVSPENDIGRTRFDDREEEGAVAEAAAGEEDTQQTLEELRMLQYREQKREREDEMRKKNIIIRGLEETIWGEAGDWTVIEDMLRKMGLKHRIYEMEFIDRIGRNSFGRRPRLILVTFTSVSAAYEIKDKAGRLFNIPGFNRVYIRKDLSQTEREEERINRRRNPIGETDVPGEGAGAPTEGTNVPDEGADEPTVGTSVPTEGTDEPTETQPSTNNGGRDTNNVNGTTTTTTSAEIVMDAESVSANENARDEENSSVPMNENVNESESVTEDDNGSENDIWETDNSEDDSDSDDDSEIDRLEILSEVESVNGDVSEDVSVNSSEIPENNDPRISNESESTNELELERNVERANNVRLVSRDEESEQPSGLASEGANNAAIQTRSATNANRISGNGMSKREEETR